MLRIVGTIDKLDKFLEKIPYILEIAGSIGYTITKLEKESEYRDQKSVIAIIWKKMARLYRNKGSKKETSYIKRSVLEKMDAQTDDYARDQALQNLII